MNLIRIIIIVVFGTTSVCEAPAQSTFRFQNYVPGGVGIDAPVFDADGNRLAGSGYAVELWGGALPDPLAPTTSFFSGQRVILPFLTGIGAGYFSSNEGMTVWTVPPGVLAWVQVRAWDMRLGPTYEDVAALGLGGYGESLPLHIPGGNPIGIPPTDPNPLYGLQSFSLRPVVPEPCTSSLLLVGGLALWCVVRRPSQHT